MLRFEAKALHTPCQAVQVGRGDAAPVQEIANLAESAQYAIKAGPVASFSTVAFGKPLVSSSTVLKTADTNKKNAKAQGFG